MPPDAGACCDQVAESIDLHAERRRDHRGGLRADDNRRAVGRAARREILVAKHGRRHLDPTEARRAHAQRPGRAAVVDASARQHRLLGQACRPHPEVDDLGRPLRVRVPVELGVAPIELVPERRSVGHGDLVRLADVADVERPLDRGATARKPFRLQVETGLFHERREARVELVARRLVGRPQHRQ
jgi:hypothetical protein